MRTSDGAERLPDPLRTGVSTGTALVGDQQALKAKLVIQLKRSANFTEAMALRKARAAERKSDR